MASPTYTAEVVVLRKTKLGESDLILTCLAVDGSQLRVVAKGARKPSSSFSSRLEVFSHARILAACGKSLDIVKEASLVDGHEALRAGYERSAAASAVCEFAAKVTEPSLEADRLFPMVCAALSAMERCDERALEALVAAALLKGLAFVGLRPELMRCVCCGEQVDLGAAGGPVALSYAEGGVVCDGCRRLAEGVLVDPETMAWLRTLLYRTFSEIEGLDATGSAAACLQVCQQWCRAHLGSPVKSVEFLLANPAPGSL